MTLVRLSPSAKNSQPQAIHTDVVVVGGGLSGLRAAVGIHRAGLSVVVLEAADRVGGKTLSVDASTPGRGKIDLGAAWINDSNQSEMYALAQAFGFDLVQQRCVGSTLFEDEHGSVVAVPFGSDHSDDRVSAPDVTTFIDRLEWDIAAAHPSKPHQSPHAKELDAITFRAYAEQTGPDAAAFAETISVGFLGVQAEEMSALYMIDYIQSGTGLANMVSDGKDGGQYLRNRQGNQTFSTRLAALLPSGSVHLSTPVVSITQTPQANGKCVVRTADPAAVFACRRVVVSVPTTHYANIKFDPPLPPAKRVLASETALGYYAKTIFVFSHPWWRDADLSGAIESKRGAPIALTRDTCVEADGQYSITCFHVGDSGRRWSKWSAAERRRQVTAHFDAVIGAAARERGVQPLAPISVVEKEWVKDPWAHGAPSPVMMPGTLTAPDTSRALQQPFDHIYFVGTETALVWKGYMEGAVRSGMRGADEVVKSLQQPAAAAISKL